MKIFSAALALPVKNLAKAKEWYSKLFQNPPIIEPAPGVVELELGIVWLQLYEKKVSSGDSAVRLGIKDLDKQHKRLRDEGLQVEDITLIPGVIRYFDFKDPDGNGLSFYQRLEGETIIQEG